MIYISAYKIVVLRHIPGPSSKPDLLVKIGNSRIVFETLCPRKSQGNGL